jgi:hypothetical protein
MTNLPALAHFNNYDPASFGWGGRDPMHDSKLLREFVFDGVSFGSMHVDVHGLFTALLTELVPHIPGGLVKGQCGCYNPGSVTVGGDRSFHTYAIAIDVNWGSNPMYAKARPTGRFALPPATSAIARRFGCEWGGDWTYPQDWMHIEVHLSPSDARTAHPAPAPDPLEEVMAMYKDKAEFEAAVRGIVREELAKGVTVSAVEAWDRDAKGDHPSHNPETLLMGVPGYQTVSSRQAAAKAKP